MKRRSLILGVFASFSAPAIVRASSMMKVVSPRVPEEFAGTYSAITVDRSGLITVSSPPRYGEGWTFYEAPGRSVVNSRSVILIGRNINLG